MTLVPARTHSTLLSLAASTSRRRAEALERLLLEKATRGAELLEVHGADSEEVVSHRRSFAALASEADATRFETFVYRTLAGPASSCNAVAELIRTMSPEVDALPDGLASDGDLVVVSPNPGIELPSIDELVARTVEAASNRFRNVARLPVRGSASAELGATVVLGSTVQPRAASGTSADQSNSRRRRRDGSDAAADRSRSQRRRRD